LAIAIPVTTNKQRGASERTWHGQLPRWGRWSGCATAM
jgi:hypothetical protein